VLANCNRLSGQSSRSSYSQPSVKKESNSLLDGEADLERQPSLKLFVSPLTHGRKAPSIPVPELSISGPIDLVGVPKQDAEIYKERLEVPECRDTPEFQRFQETTNIELFYDLFFVANLTTFTDVLDINDVESLKSYAGFFCILWFLWIQVSLFDVRFMTNSILERLGKALQFAVMIGLAITGPNFNTSKQAQGTFQTVAIILMLSRVILGSQYLLVLYHVWYFENSKIPLTAIAASNFIASIVFLGTFL
jgi:hypothetical protein